MSEPLATYLHDHFAGSTFAVNLLKTLRDQHSGEPLERFAASLLVEVEEDREVLLGIIDRVGERPPALKEVTAWLSQKLSQIKLRSDTAGELGTFEALETLSLGILGKLALWRALAVIAKAVPQMGEVDFNDLASRAEAQHGRVEERRLQTASTALVTAQTL